MNQSSAYHPVANEPVLHESLTADPPVLSAPPALSAPPHAEPAALADVAIVLELWDTALSQVAFPGAEGEVLNREAFRSWHASLQVAAQELASAERSLQASAAEFSRQSHVLRTRSQRAVAYARVFAGDNAELIMRLDAADSALGVRTTPALAAVKKPRKPRGSASHAGHEEQTALHGLATVLHAAGAAEATHEPAHEAPNDAEPEPQPEWHAESETASGSRTKSAARGKSRRDLLSTRQRGAVHAAVDVDGSAQADA